MSISERELKSGKTVYDNQFMYNGVRYKKCGFESKRKAEDWEILIKYNVNQHGYYKEPCKLTFIQVWNEYYELNKDKYAISTQLYYISTVNRKIQCNKISKKRMINISYSDIQLFFNNLAKTNNKGTCENVRKIFNLTFKHAIKCEYIENNPMKYIENKGKETKDKDKKKTISFNEFNMICNEVLKKDDFYSKSHYIVLCIGYYTGARISEILALQKSDIDFNNHTVNFNKRLETKAKKKKGCLSKMKTSSSYAIIPLAEPLEHILIEWFKINPYEKIICDEKGDYFVYNTLHVKQKIINEKLNIDFTFHNLRHSLASELNDKGVDPKTAQSILRHSNINTTLGIYTHSNIKKEKEALKLIFDSQKKEDYPKITPKSN